MVTENVDIAFRSTGIPIIKRQIDELGNAANKATRGFFLLQRAFYVIGGFGLARSLIQATDALTNMENRLRLTTSSTQELERVQRELFEISKRSRMSWEGVSEIYNRAALSAKSLGIAQADVLKFTEGVSKAAVISGAGTQEARAALIQLGQAVASNRLGGDELRSVLEQLPFAADVIAKYMTSLGKFGTVTRGNIRQLGKEGKITAQIMIDAFKSAEGELNTLFKNMPLTIGQAFEKLRTSWMQLVDAFEDSYDISGKIATAISWIADNLDEIANVALYAASTMATLFAASILQRAANFVMSIRAIAVTSTAAIARLVAIRNATVVKTQAQIADNLVYQNKLRLQLADIAQTKVMLAQEIATSTAIMRLEAARAAETGSYIRLIAAKDTLLASTRALTAVEALEAGTAARLTAARAGQATATSALATANGRLAVAQAAQAGTLATLAARFPLLGGAVMFVANGLRALWVLLAANPIGLAITAIVGLVFAFVRWGNAIKVTSDGVVGLKDAVIAAFQLMYEAVAPWASYFMSTIGRALTWVKDAFVNGMKILATAALQAVAAIVDAFTLIPRFVIAVVAAIYAAWGNLPAAAADIGARLANGLIEGFENFANGAISAINSVIGALNKLVAFVGGAKAAQMFGFSGQIGEIGKVSLGRVANSYKGAGDTAAAAFSKAFNTGTAKDMAAAAANLTKPITDRARQNRRDALEANKDRGLDPVKTENGVVIPEGGGGGGKGKGGGGGKDGKSFQELIAEMNEEIRLLGLTNKERTIAQGLIAMEKELKRGLTEEEKKLATATIQNLEAAKVQAEVLESIIGPREKAIEQMAALNVLFQQGKVSVEEYTTALRGMQIAADEAAGTLMGGFRAAIASSIQSASQFGKAIGGELVNFVNSAADAIVEFAKTGKLNIKALFQELFANLLKLAAQRLLLMFLGNFLGIPTGMGGGGGGMMGFSGGGSILPNGPGSTDSQVVAFKKRPDERVDILTPGQQAAQRKGGGGGGGTTVVQSPPVNVAAVISPSDIVGAFDQAGETVLVNMISRNASTIRKVMGG